MNRQHVVLISLLVLVALFVVGAQAWMSQRTEAVETMATEQSERFVPAHSMRYGEPDAKVVVVEFFDPACETCAQLAPAVKALVEGNPGKVQVVYRYAPFHEGSEAVVTALEAARLQDRYWTALDLLFATQRMWTEHHVASLDRALAVLEKGGLDMARLQQDMQDPVIRGVIQQDLQDAQTIGVKATPEFFVNGKPLPSWGLKQLQELVASELEAAY